MKSIIGLWGSKVSLPFDVFLRDAPVFAHSIDKKGRLLNVSQKWADCLGYAPCDMVGKRSTDFLAAKSRKLAVESVLPDFYLKGYAEDVRYTFLNADQAPVPVIMSAIAIHHRGKFQRSLAVFSLDQSSDASAEKVTDIQGQMENLRSAMGTGNVELTDLIDSIDQAISKL